MKVGDLVKHFLTDQIGIILMYSPVHSGVQVIWTTQGESLFGPGTKEWCSPASLQVLTSS